MNAEESAESLHDRVVQPLYLLLLHGNLLDLTGAERDAFALGFRTAVDGVTDDELTRLLRTPWRGALTGAYLIGALKAHSLEEQIGEALLESRTCFVGQGYCYALARLGSPRATAYLVTYLERFLPVGQREFDQCWALAALSTLDRQAGSTKAKRFLDPSLWEITAGPQRIGRLEPAPIQARFDALVDRLAQIVD